MQARDFLIERHLSGSGRYGVTERNEPDGGTVYAAHGFPPRWTRELSNLGARRNYRDRRAAVGG